jgi:hypothetical protein
MLRAEGQGCLIAMRQHGTEKAALLGSHLREAIQPNRRDAKGVIAARQVRLEGVGGESEQRIGIQ